MSETKTAGAGEAFMMGTGSVGAFLYTIARNMPPLRLDELRWTQNNRVISHQVVVRFIERGWCRIAAERVTNRDALELTEAGWSELLNFALKRAMEIGASTGSTSPVHVDPSAESSSPEAICFDLSQFAFEQARRSDPLRHIAPSLLIQDADREPVDFATWLAGEKDEKPWQRMARLFAVLEQIADHSMTGLRIIDMPQHAAWAAAVAREAFKRATDQDWEFGEQGEGE